MKIFKYFGITVIVIIVKGKSAEDIQNKTGQYFDL